MKAFRKFLLPVWLLLWVLPVESRADFVDDLKADVARLLPVGTHQDKVRQFLKVRKFKITELPKEKAMSGRFVTRRALRTESVLVVVFEFDDEGVMKNVRYEEKKSGG